VLVTWIVAGGFVSWSVFVSGLFGRGADVSGDENWPFEEGVSV
jgi:hypothetical protein